MPSLLQSSSTNTKEKYDRLKLKYGFLWSQLAEDPSVIQEYQTLLQLKSSESKRVSGNHDLEFLDSNLNRSVMDKGSSLLPTSGITGDAMNPFCNITNSNQPQNSSPKPPKIDFISAIENRQTIQIQIGGCCDFDGCEGCTDPILEFNDDKEDHEEGGQEESAEEQPLNFTTARDPNLHLDQSQSSNGNLSHNESSSYESSSSGGTAVAFDLSHLVLEDNCDDFTLLREECCSFTKENSNQEMDQTMDQGEVADDEFEQIDAAEKGRNGVGELNTFLQKCSLGQEEMNRGESFQGSPCISPILELSVHNNNAGDNMIDSGSDMDAPVARVIFQRLSVSESTLHSSPGALGKEENTFTVDGDVNANANANANIDARKEIDMSGGLEKLKLCNEERIKSNFREALKQDSIEGSEKSCSSKSSSDGGSIEFELDELLIINIESVTEECHEQDDSESVAKDISGSCQTLDVADLSIAEKKVIRLSDSHTDGEITSIGKFDTAESNYHSIHESESSDEAEWSANDETLSNSSNLKASRGNEVIIVDDSDEISYDCSSFEQSDEETNEDLNYSKAENVDSDTSSDDSSILKPTQTKNATKTNSPSIAKPKPSVTFIHDDSDSPEAERVRHRMDSSAIKQKKSKPLNFKRNRESITKDTFHEFNSRIFKEALSGVDIQWSTRLTKTAGLTRLKRRGKDSNAVRIAAIELSTKLIDCEDRLRSTLCHEMCHAAQWLVDNVAKPPHGSCFKKWARLSMRKVGTVVTACLQLNDFNLCIPTHHISLILFR